MSNASLIRELAAFVATAPESSRKEALLSKARKHLNQRTTKKRNTREHPIDRTRGVIAAILYLEQRNKGITITQLTSSIHER